MSILLAGPDPAGPWSMFVVSEEAAAAIRAAFDQGGELSAAVALRCRSSLPMRALISPNPNCRSNSFRRGPRLWSNSFGPASNGWLPWHPALCVGDIRRRRHDSGSNPRHRRTHRAGDMPAVASQPAGLIPMHRTDASDAEM
jgi:hypothetical protein